MKSETKAVICALGAVLCWSTVATSFKVALEYFNNYEMLLTASVTALAIFAVAITFQRKWGMLKALTAREWGLLALLGALNPTAYYLVLFKAYDLLPAQIAQPINYAWPIALLVLMAVVMRKPIPAGKYVGMVISLAGVATISLGGRSASEVPITGAGMALAALSALLWATYWLANNIISRRIDPVVGLGTGFFFGTLYLLAGTAIYPVHLGSMPGILASIYVGFFEIGIPFLLFGAALRHTSRPALVNQLCYLSPFLSLFVISIILKETIMPTTFIGLALIVAGLVYNQYFVKEAPKAQVEA